MRFPEKLNKYCSRMLTNCTLLVAVGGVKQTSLAKCPVTFLDRSCHVSVALLSPTTLLFNFNLGEYTICLSRCGQYQNIEQLLESEEVSL